MSPGLWVLQVRLLGRVTVSGTARVLDTVPFNCFGRFFPSLRRLRPMHVLFGPVLHPWGGLLQFPCLLSVSLHSLVLCPADSCHHGLTGLSSSSNQGVQQVLPGFPCPLHSKVPSLNAVTWGNFRVQPICFPSLRYHGLMLTNIHSSAKQCFIYVVWSCFVWDVSGKREGEIQSLLLYPGHFARVPDGRVNPIPVGPSWLESEVYFLILFSVILNGDTIIIYPFCYW